MFHKILIVDDDADDIHFFRMTMADIRPDITCMDAHDGRQALRLLQTPGQIPDLIFLDINMPIMNGWDLLPILKADPTLSRIPIVICTTSSDPYAVRRSFELGADAFLIKPISLRDYEHILGFLLHPCGINAWRVGTPPYEGLYLPARSHRSQPQAPDGIPEA